jgi:hypothetical protein
MTRKGWSVVVLICTIVIALQQTVQAQTDPNAGILPFSTHVSGQYDTLDPSSGNIMLTIPVISKAGKIPFGFNLIGNFHAFVDSRSGVWWLSDAYGSPTLMGVPSGGLGQGILGYSTTSYDCDHSNTKDQTTASNFVVSDVTGAQHAITNSYTVDYGACGVVSNPSSGMTGDGSGYTVVANPNGANTTFTVYDRSGNQVSAALYSTAGSLKDPDGVQMSSSMQLNGNMATTTYTDTLGQTVLIATNGVNRSVAGGGPSSPDITTVRLKVEQNQLVAGIEQTGTGVGCAKCP